MAKDAGLEVKACEGSHAKVPGPVGLKTEEAGW